MGQIRSNRFQRKVDKQTRSNIWIYSYIIIIDNYDLLSIRSELITSVIKIDALLDYR